jgi:hypothetical protein
VFGAAAAERVASKVGEAASAAGAGRYQRLQSHLLGYTISFLASGIADSVVGKISNAVGSAAIKAVDSAFTVGESALESAKQTSIGKVCHTNTFHMCFALNLSEFTGDRREHQH